MVVGIDAGLDLGEAEGGAALRTRLARGKGATGETVVAMAAEAIEPLRKPRREKRAAMMSPIVGVAVGLRPGPSASSSFEVRKIWL